MGFQGKSWKDGEASGGLQGKDSQMRERRQGSQEDKWAPCRGAGGPRTEGKVRSQFSKIQNASLTADSGVLSEMSMIRQQAEFE